MVRSLRGVVQIVSYKIRLALIVFRVLLLSKSLSVRVVSEMTRGVLITFDLPVSFNFVTSIVRSGNQPNPF